jgi:hypothetical protein
MASFFSEIGHDIGDFFKSPIGKDIAIGGGALLGLTGVGLGVDALAGGGLLAGLLGGGEAAGAGVAADVGAAADAAALPAAATLTAGTAPFDVGSAFGGSAGAFTGDLTGAGDAAAAGIPISGSPIGAPPSSPGFFSNLGSTLVKDLSNPLKDLGILTAGGGLIYNLMQGNKPPAGTSQLQNEAAYQGAQGAQLQSYLASGTLPPGLQAAVTQATAAAKATAISNAARNGQNTDPTQNSALAQQLASIDQNAIITTAQVGEQLLQQGLSESQLSSQIYETLVKIDETQRQQIGSSIMSFAGALGGGIKIGGGSSGGTTINLPQGTTVS